MLPYKTRHNICYLFLCYRFFFLHSVSFTLSAVAYNLKSTNLMSSTYVIKQARAMPLTWLLKRYFLRLKRLTSYPSPTLIFEHYWCNIRCLVTQCWRRRWPCIYSLSKRFPFSHSGENNKKKKCLKIFHHLLPEINAIRLWQCHGF